MSTTADLPEVTITRPAWCEGTDHDADEIGQGDPPLHYGPNFGAFSREDSRLFYRLPGAASVTRRVARSPPANR